MAHLKTLVFSLALLQATASMSSHALSSSDDPNLESIEKIKKLEKRFAEALTQTSPDHFPEQRKLLVESFETYFEGIKVAQKSGNPHLIKSLVKLADMLIDNDPSDQSSEALYQLYLKHKTKTKAGIELLDPSSTKKLKNVLKIREKENRVLLEKTKENKS